MKSFLLTILKIGFLWGSFFIQAHAVELSEISLSSDQSLMGASSLAAGSAAVATPEAEDVGMVNPALVSHIKGYFLGLGKSWLSRSEPAPGMRVALLENRPDTLIPTAIAYSERYQPAGQRVQHLRLVFGKDIALFQATQLRWGLGLSFHRWPDFSHFTVKKNEDYSARLGLHYLMNEALSWGGFVESTSLWALGASWIISPLARLRLEWLEGLRGGFEFYLNSWLIASMGYHEHTSDKTSAWSWGLRFAGPRLSLSYAWSRQSAFYHPEGQSPWEQRGEWWHRFDMGLLFW